mmetsp:Transcript_1052/g.3088  ORF Transcript_1052/g.3088 Transcript_1052/m.3088 type:complete len:188 (-) Transcript_1052:48-611(-)
MFRACGALRASVALNPARFGRHVLIRLKHEGVEPEARTVEEFMRSQKRVTKIKPPINVVARLKTYYARHTERVRYQLMNIVMSVIVLGFAVQIGAKEALVRQWRSKIEESEAGAARTRDRLYSESWLASVAAQVRSAASEEEARKLLEDELHYVLDSDGNVDETLAEWRKELITAAEEADQSLEDAE